MPLIPPISEVTWVALPTSVWMSTYALTTMDPPERTGIGTLILVDPAIGNEPSPATPSGPPVLDREGPPLVISPAPTDLEVPWRIALQAKAESPNQGDRRGIVRLDI